MDRSRSDIIDQINLTRAARWDHAKDMELERTVFKQTLKALNQDLLVETTQHAQLLRVVTGQLEYQVLYRGTCPTKFLQTAAIDEFDALLTYLGISSPFIEGKAFLRCLPTARFQIEPMNGDCVKTYSFNASGYRFITEYLA